MQTHGLTRPNDRCVCKWGFMTKLASRIDTRDEKFARNREQMLDRVEALRALERRAQSASERSSARFAKRGQLSPRERLAYLLDPGAPFFEIGSLAGYMFDTEGDPDSIPGGSQITGIGFISGVRVMVAINDSGISGGAVTRGGGKKTRRCQQIARQNRLPFVMAVESAGANLLEMRVEEFVEGGAMFADLARLSAAGVPVVTVLHGPSTAGGAYFPGLSDVVIAVEGNAKAFLGGPALLKAATGEIASEDELGGAVMHATTSGLVEHLAVDDADALRITREVIDRLEWGLGTIGLAPTDFAEPLYDPDELAGVVPMDYRQSYDIREVFARIVDGSDITEFKQRYGPATVCARARIHGWPVGLISNNGPIDNEGATKATHFIQTCSQLGTPLIYLQNTTGFMVGVAYERAGMIKHGAKMIQAVANATVPQITVTIGASFGAGNYGMNGRGFSPEFALSWPNAQTGLMGPEQASLTMRTILTGRAQRRGEPVDTAAMDTLCGQIEDHFRGQSDVFYTSGRVLDDAVIDPRDTRQALAFLLATIAESQQLQPHPVTFGVARA